MTGAGAGSGLLGGLAGVGVLGGEAGVVDVVDVECGVPEADDALVAEPEPVVGVVLGIGAVPVTPPFGAALEEVLVQAPSIVPRAIAHPAATTDLRTLDSWYM